MREKEKCPDNERAINGHAMPVGLDSNRLKIENETQTPLKRKIQRAFQSIVVCGNNEL